MLTVVIQYSQRVHHSQLQHVAHCTEACRLASTRLCRPVCHLRRIVYLPLASRMATIKVHMRAL